VLPLPVRVQRVTGLSPVRVISWKRKAPYANVKVQVQVRFALDRQVCRHLPVFFAMMQFWMWSDAAV